MNKLKQILIFLVVISKIKQCEINGYDSGKCIKKETIINNLKFCGDYLPNIICVSKKQNNFEIVSAKEKDLMIKNIFLKNIEKKIIKDFEKKDNRNMYLIKNAKCRISYQIFLCNWNIPTCDIDNNSISPCFSICKNFASNCGYSQDICSNKLIVI